MATQTTAALTGSEKQTAWAEKIRSEWIAWGTSRLARSEKELARELARTNPDAEAVEDYQKDVTNDRADLDAAHRQTSAKFWIDTRSIDKTTVGRVLRTATPISILGLLVAPVFES